ncbi:SanA/YdcF family protein [Gordonia phthalatica]|uniref:Membrane protein n=1 Tax=Gordonia phthalatica TaxID=1136941 RepID=A0A0N9NGB6_9ACTN|nr:ElyC/SanA/YdcF family protein [Gordonia phthalatica]ALG86157.1 membrane protein [Gordonia phthalatica]
MTRRWNSSHLRLAALLAVIAVEVMVAVTSTWMVVAARGRVVDAAGIPDDAPRTMIVLGAKVSDDEVGVYLRARLDVAVAAYRVGRVDMILASGNDGDDAGNEVRVMRAYLEQRGVPAHAIEDDRLGLNTNATCRRARTLYDIESATIVTQNFHVARAVTLCRAWGIDVVGVVAPCDQCSILSLVRNQLREALASRPRAVFDALRAGR